MNKKGLTLAELLIAAAIFAFAMSGILLMFISCAFLDQVNRNKSIAITHAEFVMEDIMEYMRTHEISSLQTDIGLGTWNWNTATINGPDKGLTALNNESINTIASGTEPLHITITVNWIAQTKSRSLTLETLISKR